jgi:hypothetical protein
MIRFESRNEDVNALARLFCRLKPSFTNVSKGRRCLSKLCMRKILAVRKASTQVFSSHVDDSTIPSTYTRMQNSDPLEPKAQATSKGSGLVTLVHRRYRCAAHSTGHSSSTAQEYNLRLLQGIQYHIKNRRCYTLTAACEGAPLLLQLVLLL